MRTKLSVLLIGLLFTSISISAQSNYFEKILDRGYSDLEFAPGKKIILYTNNSVACLDSLGNEQWNYQFTTHGGSNDPHSIQNYADNSVALITEGIHYTTLITRINTGTLLWTKEFQLKPGIPNYQEGSALDNDTLYVIANSTDYANSLYYPYFIKVASNGDSLLAIPLFNPVDNEIAKDIFIVNDTCIIITQDLNSISFPLYYINRFRKDGTFISKIPFALPGYEIDLILKNDFFFSLVAVDSSGIGVNHLAKIDLSGNLIWTKKIGNGRMSGFSPTSDKGFIFGTNTGKNYNGYIDIYIMKTDSLGEPEWNRTFGNSYDDDFTKVVEFPGGGYALLGAVQMDRDLVTFNSFLFKTDASGVAKGASFTISYSPIDYFNGSAAWGDYDGDNDPDLFAGGLLYNNTNGYFTHVVPNDFTNRTHGYNYYPSGINAWADIDNRNGIDLFCSGGPYSSDEWYLNSPNKKFSWDSTAFIPKELISSIGSSSIDYNNDGYLDLLLVNINPTASAPTHFLFQNSGNNQFKIANVINFPTNQIAKEHHWVDYDHDNDMDLFILNVQGTEFNYAYSNNGDGTFTDVSNTFSLYNAESDLISIEWEDVDNDKDMDAITTKAIYKNNGAGIFVKYLDLVNYFNDKLYFVDYDNDGDMDYFSKGTGNGYDLNTHLYRNDGFDRYSYQLGFNISSFDPAFLDIDVDGDIDFFTSGNSPTILMNNGNSNHWIKVKLDGVKSNTQGVGASIFVKASPDGEAVWFSRQVTSSVIKQNLFSPIHIGIGKGTIIDSLIVKWPSGCIQYFTNINPDMILNVTENCFSQSPEPIDTFVCNNNILHLTTNPGSVLNWYASPNSTQPIFTGQTFTTPALLNDTVFFVANGDLPAESRRTPVIISHKNNPIADFAFDQSIYYSQYYFHFSDSSHYAKSWLWNFEDGISSTSQNVNRVYLNNTPHTVQLIVKSECSSDTIIKYIPIASGIFNSTPSYNDDFKIFGNPLTANSYLEFIVKTPGSAKLEIFNVVGLKIASLLDSYLSPGNYKIDLSPNNLEIVNGIYFAHLSIGQKIYTIKLIKSE
jgi:hypothetical protein